MLEASFQSEIREVSREFSKLHFDIEKLKTGEDNFYIPHSTR